MSIAAADMPAQPEEITSPWLEAVLRDAGFDEARVTGCRNAVIGADQGMTSTVVRVAVEYGGGGSGPASLIVKLPRQGAYRARARAFGPYAREAGFYREAAGRSGIEVPRCYLVWHDPSSDDFVLVMEDLGGFRNGDVVAGCSQAEATLIVTQLARLHAAWWQDPALEHFSWLPPPDAVRPATSAAANVPRFLERFGDVVPPAVQDALPSLPELVLTRTDQLQAGPLTLCNGDAKLDNVVFTGDPRRPVVIFDWGTCLLTSVGYDLAYFLGDSLEPDLRRASEEKILGDYHAALLAGGVGGFSYDRLWLDYRRQYLRHMLRMLAVAGGESVIPGMLPLFHARIRRRCQAVVDLDVLGAFEDD